MSNGTSGEHDHTHDHSGQFRCENRDSCSKAICDKDRRRILGALATGGALSLAGCTGAFASTGSTSSTGQRQFDVEYTQQGETIQVGGSQTILGAGEQAGMELPFDCRAGFCGSCLSQANGDASELVDMVVNDVDLLTEDAVEDGYFLPCTSQPDTHLKVDTSASTADLLEYQESEGDEGEGEDGGDGEGEDGGDGEGEDGSGDGGTGQIFHQVTYVNEQWSLAVPEDQSLLEAGEDVGLELPFQCRVGRCGQCLAKTDGDASEVVEMETNNYGPLDDEAISNGYFLTCVGHARDDFELESGQYGEI